MKFFLLVLGMFFFLGMGTFETLAATVVGNVSVTPENEAPAWLTIPNITWDEDTTYEFSLSNFSLDRENYSLVYTSTTTEHINVNILGSRVRLIPDADFFGTRTVIFYAFDYVTQVSSNVVTLTVNDVPEAAVPGRAAPEEGEKRDTYTLDDVLVWRVEGKIQYADVEEGTRYFFIYVDERGIETHYFFEIEDVDEDVIVFLFSDGRRFSVAVGESKEIDLDGNNIPDLRVTLHTIKKNLADVTFEKVGIWRAASSLPLCEEKLYFIEDLFREELRSELSLSNLSYCHTLIFGSSDAYGEQTLPSLFIKDFNPDTEEASVLFTDSSEDYSLLLLRKDIVTPLDTDEDGIADYTVMLEGFDDSRHITLRVGKEVPFPLFVPSLERKYSYLFIAFVLSILAFMLYLYFHQHRR